MSLMDKLERKLRFLAFPNLMIYLIGAAAVGFILQYVFPEAFQFLYFDPYMICKGQVWRIFTFIMMPTLASDVFMAFITCFIYLSIARSLEQIIGTFRLNFFLLSGLILEIIFGFLYYAVFPAGNRIWLSYLSPYYLYAMLFVLFAMIFPDARFLLMFIIPVRGKWMVGITLLLYSLDVIQAMRSGMTGYAWLLVFMIIAAVLTVVLFLALTGRNVRTARNIVGRNRFQKAQAKSEAEKKTARHKCAVCGRTELTNPELEFRYCSRCSGNYEYCMEHLYTHVHITGTDNGGQDNRI